MNLPSEIGSFVRDGLRRRVPRQKVDETEFAHLWRKVRTGTEWQDRYGKTPEEVMAEEVTMKPPCKISSLVRDGLHKRATSQEVAEEELVHLWEK